MELKTLENIMSNTRLRSDEMDFLQVKKRYLELNKDNIRNLDEQLESLQVQIQQERIKSGRFNSFSINGITDYITKSWL